MIRMPLVFPKACCKVRMGLQLAFASSGTGGKLDDSRYMPLRQESFAYGMTFWCRWQVELYRRFYKACNLPWKLRAYAWSWLQRT